MSPLAFLCVLRAFVVNRFASRFTDYQISLLPDLGYPLGVIPRSKGLTRFIPSDARVAQPPSAVARYRLGLF